MNEHHARRRKQGEATYVANEDLAALERLAARRCGSGGRSSSDVLAVLTRLTRLARLTRLTAEAASSRRCSSVDAPSGGRRTRLARLTGQVAVLTILANKDEATSVTNGGIVQLSDATQRLLLSSELHDTN